MEFAGGETLDVSFYIQVGLYLCPWEKFTSDIDGEAAIIPASFIT